MNVANLNNHLKNLLFPYLETFTIFVHLSKIKLTMATKKLKSYTLDEMKDKFIGKKGTPAREKYEYELRMDLLGQMIKTTRLERNLTQEQLGKLLGVQRAQISKLESSANSATIDTILKVFQALQAEISFQVKLDNRFVTI
jgi:DNA-binding XRE family transcriptional regulator